MVTLVLVGLVLAVFAAAVVADAHHKAHDGHGWFLS